MNLGKLLLILVIILVSGCQPTPNLPNTKAASPPPISSPELGFTSVTNTPLPSSENIKTATVTPDKTKVDTPTITPSPTPIGPQVVLNGGFDSGIQGWEWPYGTLNHTRSNVHTGPGAARLATNDYSGIVEYRGNAGQCIDLTNYLDFWPIFEGQKYITLEAYLFGNDEILNVTLNGIFIDDTHCGTGQVGSFDIPSIEDQGEWVKTSGTTSIPDMAKSLHVFVNASGVSAAASVIFDDIRAYAVDSPGK